jgi:stringent starvation protein B
VERSSHTAPPAASTKPYLIRAIREWAADNGFTPQILVDATVAGVEVPRDYVQDDRITLNVGDQAVQQAAFGNDWIRFSARFSGRAWDIQIPVAAVLAIYARENGHGFIFSEEGDTPPPPAAGEASGEAAPKKKPSHLKVVK